MKNIFQIACFCLLSISSIAQLNLTEVGTLDLNSAHFQGLNDIWGYTDEFGNEYALVGGTKGTSVVDISDPANPVEVFFEPGLESIWRDIKTVGDYAYVTTEAQNGLLIIDLSPLPSSSALTTSYYTGPIGNEWQSAHNLYADENGPVYIFGANRGNGGVIILDVSIDPMNPVEVGVFDNWYVHDGYAENDTMYLGHISDGFFSVVDAIDPANPVLLGTHDTPSTFSHNVWTMGGNYAFTTDEVSGGYIGAYDISDPANIVELDRIQSSPGAGVIPHNTHVKDNFLVTSYYSDGVTVHDATYPYNLIEVANYDTYPLQTTGYDGCWGVYPFFPSGLMVASDREYGLFVLSPNYVQAAYLEGVVTNAQTSQPIQDVLVEINGSNQPELTNLTGFYATGMAAGGTYDVTYSKIGYYPQTISTILVNGQLTIQDVALTPIPPFNLDILVLEEGTNAPIDNAQIRLEGSIATHEGTTNALGEESFTMFYEEAYRVFVGKWKSVSYCEWLNVDAQTGSLTIYLKPGYYDDFTFDFGWTTAGDASTGQFERAIPFGSLSSPSADSDSDCSDYCYITENSTTSSLSDGDVDAGFVLLRSPIMNLSGMTDPYVHYERWFYSDQGILPPGDSLEIFLGNGVTQVKIDAQQYDTLTWGQWISKDLRILDYLALTPTMQFTVFTSDYGQDYNVTEAGLDNFYIVEAEFVSVPENELQQWTVYPNPTNGTFYVKDLTEETKFEIVSYNGASVVNGTISNNQQIDISGLSEGVYFIKMNDAVQKIVLTK